MKRRKLELIIGTERGSRALRRASERERGFEGAMAEAMILAVGGSEDCPIDAERSICGTSAKADFAGEGGSAGARHAVDDVCTNGDDVRFLDLLCHGLSLTF